MNLYHNSRDKKYRSPFGAAPVGTKINIWVDAELPEGSLVFLRLWQNEEERIPMVSAGGNRLTATVRVPEEPGLLWYYFVAELPERTVYYGKTDASRDGTGTLTDTPPESWQITVYQPRVLPEWYGNAVAYQIFPDRFHRGSDWEKRQEDAAHPEAWNGTRRVILQEWNETPIYCKDASGRVTRWPFFGGTLEGIREKLPYLKSLGVGVLYLNPIFTAASNHKYDTGDYLTIDPGFGDEESFSRLCAEAEREGIRILLDGVFSHTGDDSIYFNRYGDYPEPGAWSPEESPYDSWYRFGSEHPCGYASWWGVDSLPEVEETNPGYREFICGENGVIRKWLRLGASGWRLDVADELPDSFIADIRTAVKTEKPDALLLGEVWEDASNKVSYDEMRSYLLGSELDCTMHYPFRTGALDFLLGRQDAAGLRDTLDTIRENYPPTALYGALNLVGTHDTPRILTVLGEAPEDLPAEEQEEYRLPPAQREKGLRRLRLLQVLQFTSPGVPCIYYGDEAGMEGYADPYNRGPYPWGQEDGDLVYWVRMLSHLRKEYPVLVQGDVSYAAPMPEVFSMTRTLGVVQAKIFINRGESPAAVSPEQPGWLDLLTGNVYADASPIPLPGMSALVLYREGSQESFSQLPAAARTPHGSGILCPLFSLPGDGPVGNMYDAMEFLDVLKKQGYENWMLLPLCPAGLGDSPYSSPSVFAGDPRFISPDLPVDMTGYDTFCRENETWLPDYALYTVLHRIHGKPWQEWPEDERSRKDILALYQRYDAEMREIMEEQFRFFAQWQQVRDRAEVLGISLIGDLPVYAASDSADAWSHWWLFQLDPAGHPLMRSGCPPDYFTPEGQDWGNPLYRWDDMAKAGYGWWKMRFKRAFRCFDYVRLDHFRSFAAYYAIPAGEDARHGYWMKGIGVSFFRAMVREFGTLPIVAEDLGALDSQVSVLLRHTGLSGMNVWQFSANEMAGMSPAQASHRVFFSGTHDNQTLKGYLASTGDSRDPADILRELLNSPASAVILPVQDVLGLGDEARVNVPGVPEGNWRWRMTGKQLEFLGTGGIL